MELTILGFSQSRQPGSFDVIIARQHALHAERDMVMVNPSVRLPVHLSDFSKWFNISSIFSDDFVGASF